MAAVKRAVMAGTFPAAVRGRRALAVGVGGTVPATVLGEPPAELMTEIEGLGYSWPTGRYAVTLHPRGTDKPGRLVVTMACRCGDAIITDILPSAGACMQYCGCELGDCELAAFDRVFSAAIGAAIGSAVRPRGVS